MVGEADVLLNRPRTLERVRTLYDSAIRCDEAHGLCGYIDSQPGSPGKPEMRNPLPPVYHALLPGTNITSGTAWPVQGQKFASEEASHLPLSFRMTIPTWFAKPRPCITSAGNSIRLRLILSRQKSCAPATCLTTSDLLSTTRDLRLAWAGRP